MFDFYKLKNGVRVVLAPMDGVKSVAAGVYAATGSRYETSEINGLSHFLEHMAFKGTKKFPTQKETSYLEGLGAIQNAWTSVDGTAYWCKIPADRWREGLEMAKELALYPTIPEKELEIERGVILEEIHRRDDRPDEQSAEELQKLMFPGNGLGMTTLGDENVIKRVKRQDFLDYHDKQYVAGRLVVAIAGNIKNEIPAIKEQIEEWLGSLPAEKGEDFVPVNNGQTEPALKLFHKEKAAQAHLQIGFRGTTIADPRRFASEVLVSYLGHGMSSRLFNEVREKRGLCYQIMADEDRLPDTGIWSVYAGLNYSKLKEAIKAIMEELARAKSEKISEKELAESKEKLRGSMIFMMENPIHQMEFFARQAMEKPDEILTYEQVIDRLMQINAQEIQKVAEDIFVRHNINLAVVGPTKEEEKEELENLLQLQ